MRVVVTGGAGFIGHHTVSELVMQGHEPLVVDDLSLGLRENLPSGTPFVKADVLDREKMARIFSDFRPEGVVHLAARVSIRDSGKCFLEDARQNVMGTATVLDTALSFSVRRFVLAGSMAVYGDSPDRIPVSESCLPAPLSAYGVSKLAAENLVLCMGRQTGMEAVVLRIFNTFGTGQRFTPYVGVVTIFIQTLLEGKAPVIFGDGNQCRDFIHVKDVARAMCLALMTPSHGTVFNIGTGREKSVKEVAGLLLERMGSDLSPVYRPKNREELLYCVADTFLAEKLLGFRSEYSLEEKVFEVMGKVLENYRYT